MRMIIATAFVVLITGVAPALGPHLAGLLSPFPLFTATLAAFGQHLHGPAAAIKVLRGLLMGLFSYATFMLTLSLLLEPAGIATAFAAAIAITATIQAVTLWLIRRGTGENSPMASFELSARQPFNFRSVINSHGWIQLAPFRFDEERRTLFYTDRLSNDRAIEYRVTELPGGVRVHTAGRLNKLEKSEIADKVTWMFGLNEDFASFYKAARGEPKLRKARRLAHGRVLRSPTFFEDVVKTILTTNTLWGATKRMNLNLIATYADASDGARPSNPFRHPKAWRPRARRCCGRRYALAIAPRPSMSSPCKSPRPASMSNPSRHRRCRRSSCARSCSRSGAWAPTPRPTF